MAKKKNPGKNGNSSSHYLVSTDYVLYDTRCSIHSEISTGSLLALEPSTSANCLLPLTLPFICN